MMQMMRKMTKPISVVTAVLVGGSMLYGLVDIVLMAVSR